MAPKGIEIVTILVILTLLSVHAMAQSGCTSVILSMASCLSYVSGSSPTPSSSCCSALGNVVQTNPRCLCAIVNGGGSSVGVNINQTLALGLPNACKVHTPPVSRCKVVNGPAMSPVGSPEGAPPDSADPNSAMGPSSVTGSKTTPENGTSSGGSTRKIHSFQLATLFFVLVSTSFASIFSSF